ncbi:DNA-directed RNA polymerase III subunit RPC3 [Empidonax traillii]|uniref:DNA-directed RNA polymerase III subunit RPC3 n=1 Tax=Empidonax traillii TaxID=164674 RepID=UPI000FFDA5A6|nr:DNA-directed RNA polymerase III subunit RPC3 [Empidonax traillii]XP_027765825.1 DNA-directed RNA polymerase III subunit RPC3 [Empidonax traillii]
MTQAELRLCSLLLQEHFGEIVEKVGTSLLRTGPRPLRLLVGDTGLLPDQVKKALCVLLQHDLARFEAQPRGPVEYEARSQRILRILRYPRYIYTAKTLYGDPGELLVEELLLHGHLAMSCAVARVADRLTDTMEDGKSMDYSEVCSTFARLADTHFIRRCPMAPESPPSAEGAAPPPAPALAIAERDMYAVPRLGLAGKGKRSRSCEEEEEDGQRKAKRQRQEEGGSSEPPPDDGIYWQVNLERFHQHFRDQALVSAVGSRMDQTSSEVVRTMLRMSEVTTASGASHTQPLSSNEIFRALPAGYNIGKQVLDQYLALLADDPLEFVGKSGDSGGGTYTVNLHKALASLATATLESIVEERFGSRCARIFRLLLRKKHLEQKQVEDFAMIPAKEAKDMLYRMLSENLVSLQEIPKTPDHAPSRTFYLYTVNVAAAARMLLHRCYKSAANLMERRQHETRENKRLLEKSQRVEAILASMQATGAEAAQLREVEEMITGPERQQLESLKRSVNKIDASENQVDETIFVLESFIESTVKRP